MTALVRSVRRLLVTGAADATSYAVLSAALADVDALVHLAALPHPTVIGVPDEHRGDIRRAGGRR